MMNLCWFGTSVGGLMGIVIGPLCNYISDRRWRRRCRRRPFLLVAMLGHRGGHGADTLHKCHAAVISSLLGDVGSTFAPLWLEVIPAEQRGSGVVMRNVMISIASCSTSPPAFLAPAPAPSAT